MTVLRQDITASGTYTLCGRNSGTPLVQMDVSSDFVGNVIFYKDATPPGGASNLIACTQRERGSANPVQDHPASTAWGADINLEPATSGLPLVAVVTFTTAPAIGTCTLTTLPEWPGTPSPATVYFGDITLTELPPTVQEDLALMLEMTASQQADIT